MTQEPLTPAHIQIIRDTLGMGASFILDLHLADFTRGSVKTDKGRSFWLTDGRRVDIEMGHAIIATVTKEPDPNRPAPMKHNASEVTPEFLALLDKMAPFFGLVKADAGNGYFRWIEGMPPLTTRKCIHPECYVQVDLTKRKSGACCKAHMNFECSHPDCVKRAKENGWPKATHPHGTKIGAAHWEFRAIPLVESA